MRKGLGYESEVKEWLLGEYGEQCHNGQWFLYTTKDSAQIAYCQIDAYIVDDKNKKIIVIETKLKHTIDAWNQLELLYIPVLKKFYGPGWTFCSVEICRLYDPSIANGFTHHIIDSLSDASPKDFNVLQWAK